MLKKKEGGGEGNLRVSWRLCVKWSRPTTAFDDCILDATKHDFVCMYAAFKTNTQGYRKLSSNTACGIFQRGNYTDLSVRQFAADGYNDGMSKSFGLRWISLIFLSKVGFTELFVRLLHWSILHTRIYIYVHRGGNSLVLLFFPPGSLYAWACALWFQCLALRNHYILKRPWQQNQWLSHSEWTWCFLSSRPSLVAQWDCCLMD